MYRHLLILPDGTEIFSGAERENVLQSVTVTRSVNAGQELTLGSACAGELRAELITPNGGLSLAAGDAVTVFRVDETEARTQMGIFYLEKPERGSAHTLQLTGYDAVSRLDTDLTGWLKDLDQWPYAALEFARMVCTRCGLTLLNEEIPNGDFYLEPFSGEGITGRQLIQWLGQIFGRFCRATAEGQLEFAWYAPNDQVTITPHGEDGSVFYYGGQLQYADYETAPIEKIQLRQNAQDVGTVWPNEAGEKNTYVLENNPMLANSGAEALLPVAQTLFAHLQGVCFTPCTVTIPATPGIGAGDILTLTDANGKTITTWVMKKTANGLQDTLECTGSYRRDSVSVVNNRSYQALTGKVLNLRLDVDGLKLENKDTGGKLASINLDLEKIRSRMERQEATTEGLQSSFSTLTQTAEGLSLELETIRRNGTDQVKTAMGYTFNDQGLHISRPDSDMENLLDHTGMYVRRNSQVVLQANNHGVAARDVTVKNYLIIGENSRIEDYGGNRTACFYIG